MSDDWIALIPVDPRFIPAPEKQLTARNRLEEIAPDAHEFTIRVSEAVQFFDCGANLDNITCAACGAELPFSWWEERMGDDYLDDPSEKGFKLAHYRTPCCNTAFTLHELVYDLPQAFGRFALEVLNPNIGTLDESHRQELEEILGTKLIVVYQHV